ncbi:MAG TPA: hypothetical protein VN416_00895, partial [Desulfomonilia bacterium]|nr:hypothetical protein [Desulfomonilia bacterium]
MNCSPAHGLTRPIRFFAGMGRKYGVEWWILCTGATVILSIILMAIFSPVIAPFDPYLQDAGPQLAPPGAAHLMGTD